MENPSVYCYRFERCGVNNCPLHPAYPNLPTHDDDAEKRCKAPKGRRLSVAERFPGVLRYGGMTLQEHAATMRVQKSGAREKLIQSGKKSRFSPSG